MIQYYVTISSQTCSYNFQLFQTYHEGNHLKVGTFGLNRIFRTVVFFPGNETCPGRSFLVFDKGMLFITQELSQMGSTLQTNQNPPVSYTPKKTFHLKISRILILAFPIILFIWIRTNYLRRTFNCSLKKQFKLPSVSVTSSQSNDKPHTCDLRKADVLEFIFQSKPTDWFSSGDDFQSNLRTQSFWKPAMIKPSLHVWYSTQ